ncbi:hypothetical protein ES288_D01G133400v1 [Gossypium darwinii]|uniref:Uncharacterized protein n=2 Tax=Gossypium TaxID=3633 RepID=A0A5D2M8M4_GOSTO|nr:hypothetical protein ES288_D01G133400v1 [Gossypium darwinii]TYH87663.1 hypothetical protein ES332_D01G133900v1 [Gossypium tomentosum]
MVGEEGRKAVGVMRGSAGGLEFEGCKGLRERLNGGWLTLCSNGRQRVGEGGFRFKGLQSVVAVEGHQEPRPAARNS